MIDLNWHDKVGIYSIESLGWLTNGWARTAQLPILDVNSFVGVRRCPTHPPRRVVHIEVTVLHPPTHFGIHIGEAT